MWLVGAHHCTHSDLWYVMAYLISNMIFAICKYFLPFDGRPWHRFEWLAHSDMGLTAKWLCQPGKCFQLPHPSPPKKNIYPNEHSRVSNIGVVARAVRVCMRNPNNGPHIGNQSVYDLKNKSTWGQICVIVYSCLYIYIMCLQMLVWISSGDPHQP